MPRVLGGGLADDGAVNRPPAACREQRRRTRENTGSAPGLTCTSTTLPDMGAATEPTREESAFSLLWGPTAFPASRVALWGLGAGREQGGGMLLITACCLRYWCRHCSLAALVVFSEMER